MAFRCSLCKIPSVAGIDQPAIASFGSCFCSPWSKLLLTHEYQCYAWLQRNIFRRNPEPEAHVLFFLWSPAPSWTVGWLRSRSKIIPIDQISVYCWCCVFWEEFFWEYSSSFFSFLDFLFVTSLKQGWSLAIFRLPRHKMMIFWFPSIVSILFASLSLNHTSYRIESIKFHQINSTVFKPLSYTLLCSMLRRLVISRRYTWCDTYSSTCLMSRRSFMVWMTSSWVSPRPSMMDVLV